MSEKQHYHLVSGMVMFTDPRGENPEQIGNLSLNTVIYSPEPYVGMGLINKAQQLLQINFHQKLADPELQVFDVFIVGISPLGHMTDAEFTAGLDAVEAEAPTVQ